MPAGSGLGGSLLTLGAGGVTYEIPVAALPYLGKGLDPNLFTVSDLLSKERSGRVPVRVGDPAARITGRYEINENGKKIAAGNAVGSSVSYGDFYTTVTLGSKPSTIRFVLNASRKGAQYPLSASSHAVWTWRSAHESGVSVPRGWACRVVPTAPHLRGRDCAAEPMMTLRYSVAGLALNGSAAAGRQSVGITVGHIQLAAAAKITGAKVQVSLDGGKTWRAARVTGSGGAYRAAFTAAAGRYVTLRVTAADAAGGKISETITRAYKIAS